MLYIIDLKKLRWFLMALPFIIFCFFIAEPNKAGLNVSGKIGERVLIIDAGHGGEDGGAVGANGQKESEINLSIARKMEALAGFLGVPHVMTRQSEDIAYPPEAVTTAQRKRSDQYARATLIAGYPRGVLISIHQNCYPDPRPFGSQALYGAVTGSRELGEIIHAHLITFLCPDNRRVAAPVSKDVYLMRNAKCTAVLVECGFISNSNELALLLDGSYQIKISAILVSSYMEFAGLPGESVL